MGTQNIKHKHLFIYLTTFLISISCVYSQSIDKNWIKSETIFKKGVDNENEINGLYGQEIQEAVAYFDGLGRANQSIILNAAPSGEDIVSINVYDKIGRESRMYLPYAKANTGGYYVADAENQIISFYLDPPENIPSTNSPFSEKEYEGSPLNRIIKQSNPGDSWNLNSGNSIQFNYLANEIGEVKRFDLLQNSTIEISQYESSTLYKMITYDEDGNPVIEYKDKLGNVVLKRTISDNINHDTYYVYNDLGLLCYVIMPQAETSCTLFSDYDHCFRYKYDHKNNLVEKILPGQDTIFYIYDLRDKVILTQDGNLRRLNGWKFSKYDAPGRPVLEGIYHHDMYITRNDMQQLVTDQIQSGIYKMYEESSDEDIEIYLGYTNQAFPGKHIEFYKSYYYDHYDFNRDGNSDHEFYYEEGYDIFPDLRTHGMLTSTITYIDDGANWIQKVIFYDEYRHAIHTTSIMRNKSLVVSKEYADMAYSFSGNILERRHHLLVERTNLTFNYSYDYAYDNSWRLSSTDIRFNDSPTGIRLSANQYNNLGDLIVKTIHNPGNRFLIHTVYTYNIRNWLTSLTATNSLLPQPELFSLEIYYDDPPDFADNIVTPYFNGNISLLKWSNISNDFAYEGYGMKYDALNRLKDAYYFRKNAQDVEWFTDKQQFSRDNSGYVTGLNSVLDIKYDKNGNILKLNRANQQGTENVLMDEMEYFYNANRLKAVDDDITGTSSLYDYNDNGHYFWQSHTDEYDYDENGNMVTDNNRNLAVNYSIYNNKPSDIYFGEGRIRNNWDADGIKRLKESFNRNGQLVSSETYLDHFIILDNEDLRIITPEGYIKVDPTQPISLNHYYLIKDHLGNVRVVVQPIRDNTSLHIHQVNDYYPFGMVCQDAVVVSDLSENPYLYNGKEKQTEMMEGWYDYGARFYDPQLGRWHVGDPLASESQDWSPYRAFYCNPINFSDPTGLFEDWVQNKISEKYVWMDKVTSVNDTPQGYRYIGPAENDILRDLNLPYNFPTINSNRVGFGLDGDGKAGVPVGSNARASGKLLIKANISYNKENATENNLEGKKFEGVTFKAFFSQSSSSANSNLNMTYKGFLAVQYGDDQFTSILAPLSGTKLYETGTVPMQASINIPARDINKSKVFDQAYISAGTLNPGLIISPRPIKMNWNLKYNHILLQN